MSRRVGSTVLSGVEARTTDAVRRAREGSSDVVPDPQRAQCFDHRDQRPEQLRHMSPVSPGQVASKRVGEVTSVVHVDEGQRGLMHVGLADLLPQRAPRQTQDRVGQRQRESKTSGHACTAEQRDLDSFSDRIGVSRSCLHDVSL